MVAALFLVLAGCSRDTQEPSDATAPDGDGLPVYTFTVDDDLLQEPIKLATGVSIRPPAGWRVHGPDSDLFRQFAPAEQDGFELEQVAVLGDGAALTMGSFPDGTPPEAVVTQLSDNPDDRDVFLHNGLTIHQVRVMTDETLVFALATAGETGTTTIQLFLATAVLNEDLMRQVESVIGSLRPVGR